MAKIDMKDKIWLLFTAFPPVLNLQFGMKTINLLKEWGFKVRQWPVGFQDLAAGIQIILDLYVSTIVIVFPSQGLI